MIHISVSHRKKFLKLLGPILDTVSQKEAILLD